MPFRFCFSPAVGSEPRNFNRITGKGNFQEHKAFQANLVVQRYKAHNFPLSAFSITGNSAKTQLPSSGTLWNVFILAYQPIRYAADIQLVFSATSSLRAITMSTCSCFKGKSRPCCPPLSHMKQSSGYHEVLGLVMASLHRLLAVNSARACTVYAICPL